MIENSKTFPEKKNISKKAGTMCLLNISAKALDARKKKLSTEGKNFHLDIMKSQNFT